MKAPIPIALMGLGWVGTHRHAAAIARSPNFRLVGVIDRNAERARLMGKKLNVQHVSHVDRIPDVPWLQEAAAITIATPPHLHCELAIDALSRGLHVLTEKPFAMQRHEGEMMARCARDAGKILGVTHNFQFSRSAQCLARDMDLGRLGRLSRIHAVQLSNPRRRLPSWYETLPAGLFYDESPHLLYLIRRFAPGPLELAQATVLPSRHGTRTPSLVQARYRCAGPEGTFPVTLDMHFEAPLSEWHLIVHGEEAMGVIDIFRDIYLRLPNDGLHVTTTVLRSSLLATTQHWLQHFTSGVQHLLGKLDYGNNEIYRRFADAIRTGRSAIGMDPEAALAVLNMQHDILEQGSTAR
ncbi:MAG: Gfo/Idh/MocA family oxidoreductase [Curvibacter sp.]|nr:Gfo/Idh/MocA family oxidoreductase [Curvibacter sp.]